MQLSTIREVAVLRHQENSSTTMWSGNGARGKPSRRHPFPAPQHLFTGRVSAGKTSFQNCNITNHMKNMNKLDDMKFYIRKINAERLELFRILDIDLNTDLNYRMNTEFTIIKSQHEKTMLDMEKMTQSISDTIEKYKEFIEDKDSYRCEILQQELEHGTDQDKVSFEDKFYRGISACAKQILHLIPSNHGYHLLHFLPLLLFPCNE
ncbi:uncharacterized protein LOC100040545 isoform 2 [Mus musculus]|uniref:uncharacterized protein LOC100040545 isoform 2 n=1 Tax=Mus musculus TaxID=10090 RepID=UPI0011AEB1C8|nr:uncharacterized protein LOC100040545 isoform 2 [Mus musculus]